MFQSRHDKALRHLEVLIKRYPALKEAEEDITQAYFLLKACYERDGKLLIAGNGGSAADAEHITGELMKRFSIPRPVPDEMAEKLKAVDPERGTYLTANLERPLTAIPLTAHESLMTAYINDVDANGVFAQQLYGYGRKGDVFFAITTSGNSENILCAAVTAKALGIGVVGLTGKADGKLSSLTDVLIRVPATETYQTQELHVPVYHCLCQMLEDYFFGGDSICQS